MNLKDMTNEQLLAEEDSCQYDDSYPFRETAHGEEILRRLNEADELRKENEKLKAQNILIRGDSAELLAEADAYSFNLSNMNASIAELRKENEELRKDKERIDFLDDGNYGIDPRNIPGVIMNGRRFHCLAGRGDWSSLRDAIDAARLVKESEANHE